MANFKKKLSHHKKFIVVLSSTLLSAFILTISVALLETAQDTRSRAADGPCTLSGVSTIDSEEARFMEILNEHRRSLGRSELRLSGILTKAAHWQAEDMAENNYHSHTDSLGRGAQERFAACGSTLPGGENIVWSTTSAQNAFDRWMASPGHKENMERASFSQAGIARIREGNTWTWVNTFTSGNDGTSPDTESPETPTAAPTDTTSPTITPTPTGSSSTPTATPITATATPADGEATLAYSFKLPGIGGNTALGENSSPKRPERSVPVVIRGNGEIAVLSVAKYNPSNSLFEGNVYIEEEKLSEGATVGFILKSFLEHDANIGNLNNLTFGPFTYIGGDIDSSNTIDLNDYTDTVACIKQIRCTPSKEAIDLNDDGLTDAIDLNILLRSFTIANSE